MGNSPFRFGTTEKTLSFSGRNRQRARAGQFAVEVLYTQGAPRVRHLQNVLLFLQMLLKSVQESTAASPQQSQVNVFVQNVGAEVVCSGGRHLERRTGPFRPSPPI